MLSDQEQADDSDGVVRERGAEAFRAPTPRWPQPAFQRVKYALGFDSEIGRTRGPPILAMIPAPAQCAVTFLAGVGVDRFMPWRPAWLPMEGVHCAGAALAFAGFILSLISAE